MINKQNIRNTIKGILWFPATAILLLVLALPLLSLNPKSKPHNYIHKQWSTQNGLPQNTVTCIAQDQTGFLWLGTQKGVARFNGKNVTIYNKSNTPQMASNTITVIHSASDNSIWIGTKGTGICVYDCKSRKFRTIDDQSLNYTTSICEDNKKNIWIGTQDNGITRISNKKTTSFKANSKNNQKGLAGNHINTIYNDKHGNIWIGTTNGLNLFKDNTFIRFTTKNNLPSNNITAINEDQYNNIWIGTAKGPAIGRLNHIINTKNKSGIHSINFIPLTSHRSLNNTYIHSILHDKDRVTWISADNKILKITHAKKRIQAHGFPDTADYFISNAFPNPETSPTPCLTLFEDNEGILWIGTLGNGLNSLRNSSFIFYNTTDGLSNNHITTIYTDGNQNLWVGTGGGGLNKFKNNKITSSHITYTKKSGLSCNTINTILEDNNRNLWIGTPDGLNRFKNNTFTTFTKKNGLSGNRITTLYTDREGTLWIGTEANGLTWYQNERFHALDSIEQFSNNPILCLKEDMVGSLWVGTAKGLYRLRYNRITPFIQDQRLSLYTIYDIYEDDQGVLWLGTGEHGLLCFDAGRLIAYKTDKKFSTACIYKILKDRSNNFWMSSSSGLFFIAHNSIDRFSSPSLGAPVKYFNFVEGDGLQCAVFTGYGQPAGRQTTDGQMWLPTPKGLISFNPDKTVLEPPLVPVVIEKVMVNGKEVPKNQDNQFSEESWEISFLFTAVNLRPMENMKVKWRLTHLAYGGYHQEELEAQGNKITFSKLKQGKYNFYVYACNGEGAWNELGAGDSFSFTIYSGPGWDTVLFIIIPILAVMLLVVSKIVDRRRKQNEVTQIFKDDARYQTSSINTKEVKKYLKLLLDVMEKEKPFLDPNMSVAKLAKRLNVSKEHISQVVNQQLYMNFNHFLNKYRIEEAKRLLSDPKENQFVLLKIAHDVGFNSKSTFNSAFKKITGISPSQYREKEQAKQQAKQQGKKSGRNP